MTLCGFLLNLFFAAFVFLDTNANVDSELPCELKDHYTMSRQLGRLAAFHHCFASTSLSMSSFSFSTAEIKLEKLETKLEKVITTMVIRLLYIPSAFTHLGLWRKRYDCSSDQFRARKCFTKRALLIFSSISSHLAAI